MRPRYLSAVVAVLLVSLPASAAVRYEFRQTTRSDVQALPSGDLAGRATIDGSAARVDFVGKSMYGENAWVVTRDGGKNLLVFDPTAKTYVQIDVDSVAAALGATEIDITNLKSNVKLLPDHPQIAGYPTDHYRMESSYDVTVRLGELLMTQTVHTVIEKWTTNAFGEVEAFFLMDGGVRTGNPKLDEIITLETSQMKGLPLRQMVRITTSNHSKGAARTPSKIALAPNRTQLSEMLVTSIQMVNPEPSTFSIPPGYRKVESDQKQESVQNLTLQ